MVTTLEPERAAFRLRVTGLVQGVGFRPFVHRLALRHHLGGWVRNATGDVQISIEGSPAALEEFVTGLRLEAPPLARIEALAREPGEVLGLKDFSILPSAQESGRRQPVSPDVGICSACEAELFDPGNRRFRYPFITCTDCGPRYTVIESMPYDRERTSMAAFLQCPACLAEYHDPADRRYHSETNSCAACGPRLCFSAGSPGITESAAALAGAASILAGGGVLAIRGLGGFHLAVDAGDAGAVARLRSRKDRDAKPLAVMVPTLEAARRLAIIGPAEAELLTSPERPIVLLAARPGNGLAPGVAPGLSQVGIMLAYTPLHHLLLDLAGRPLVMTSGNRSDEPIATGNGEALTRLGPIADGFLLHDRDIVARYDDSVVRVVCEAPVFLRRARGYAPLPLPLPVPSPRPLLAVGPHLKNTLTLVHGATAYVSQHVGDLDSPETLEHFEAILAASRRLFRIEPEVVVRDAHPGYLSSRLAEELRLPRTISVQHHHAHIAAVMAEHGVTTPVLGIAYDGTGYGEDGTTWGAEFLVADLIRFTRVGHLLPAPLPGGDLAARTPWRAALGYLSTDPAAAASLRIAFEGVDPRERAVAERQIAARFNAPMASSMGRLFDAAAAVIGLRRQSSYEGQAAMELESLAARRPASEYPCRLDEVDGRLVLDPLPLLAWLGARRQRGVNQADLAADFHASIAWSTAVMATRLARAAGVATVALGGGVFQNARLLESLQGRLETAGLRVLIPRRLSPNDGAISYGQAAVGAALLAAQSEG
jgi:hydrogenase maturation protein HypF